MARRLGWLGVFGPSIISKLGIDYPQRQALELVAGAGVTIDVEDNGVDAIEVTIGSGDIQIPSGQRIDDVLLMYNGAPTPAASPVVSGPRIVGTSTFDDGTPSLDGLVYQQIYSTFTTSTSVQPILYVNSQGLAPGWGVACDFNVVARDSGGNLGRAKVTGCYRRVASANPTVVGTPVIGTWDGTSGGTLAFGLNGSQLVLNATPANTTRRLWSVQAMLTFMPPVDP